MPGPWDQPPEEDDKDRQNGGSRAGRAVAIGLILVAGLVVGLVVMRGEALDDDSWARLIYLGLLLSVIVTGLSAGFVRNMRRSLRDIGIWLALGGGLLLVYSFADEFGMVADRLSGQVDPTSPRQMADGGVAITADERGHFVLRAQVEGAPVVFMWIPAQAMLCCLIRRPGPLASTRILWPIRNSPARPTAWGVQRL